MTPSTQKKMEVKRIEHSLYAEIVGNITTRNSERKDTRRQNNPIVLAGHICVQDIELKVMVGQPDLFVCFCFYLLLLFFFLHLFYFDLLLFIYELSIVMTNLVLEIITDNHIFILLLPQDGHGCQIFYPTEMLQYYFGIFQRILKWQPKKCFNNHDNYVLRLLIQKKWDILQIPLQ
jgi:hypothetical protein